MESCPNYDQCAAAERACEEQVLHQQFQSITMIASICFFISDGLPPWGELVNRLGGG